MHLFQLNYKKYKKQRMSCWKYRVKFNVKNVDGQWQQIHGFVGESFLDALMRGRVDGVMQPHLCMGGDLTYRPHYRPHDAFSTGPTCEKWIIVLKENWNKKVNQ